MNDTLTLEKLQAVIDLIKDVPFTGYVCGPAVYHKLREASKNSPVFPTNFSNLYCGSPVAVDYEMAGDKIDVYDNREAYEERVRLIEAKAWLKATLKAEEE